MTSEELGKLVEDAANSLGEHFEAVQILVSNSDGEGSQCLKRGTGNFYARLGMATEFLEMDRAQILADAIREEEE